MSEQGDIRLGEGVTEPDPTAGGDPGPGWPERPAETLADRGEAGRNDGEATVGGAAGERTLDADRATAGPGGGGARPAPRVPGYEVLGELGRGGMGVVYHARHVLLNRPCALKMVLAGAHADAEATVRFLAEAEAIARLQHPNVVQIHHVGEVGGLPFFELEYVEDGSLDKRLDGTPWPARKAAELVAALAGGVAEAHRLGIVHRDLKPGNILIAADGTPKVTDFGLAKALSLDSGLTRTESILGSPSYMAPEQAGGQAKNVGPAADVYALGAILYELLTGRPPFKGASVMETLDQVKHAEPVPPGRLVPNLPRDLETIVLKCLRKDPAARYATAGDLVDDLRRFLAGEPIRARRAGAVERAWRWARRNPVVAGLTAALWLALAGGLTGMAVLWSRAEANATRARANEREAKRLAGEEKKARTEAQDQTKVAQERAEDLAWQDYINRVNRAYREVMDDNVALAEDLLLGCPAGRRGWEWRYVMRLCHLDRMTLALEEPVNAVAFSPDGRFLATGASRQFMGSGEAHVAARVELRDRASGRTVREFPGASRAILTGLAFSPDGSRVAISSGSREPQGGARVGVRDVRTGAVAWDVDEPGDLMAMAVAYAPDGKTLAVGLGLYSQGQVGRTWLLDAADGHRIAEFPGPKGGVNDLAFHPDGTRLAVAGSEVVEIWDVARRAKVKELPGHRKWVYALAYSPDGKWLATGGWDRTILLRDAASGEPRLTLYGHEGFVYDLKFSPDGRSLASGGEDRVVRLWEVPGGRPVARFRGHSDFVHCVAFSPDGRELASGGLDARAKVWDLKASRPVVFEGHTGWVTELAFLRDGRRVLSEAGAYRAPGDGVRGWDPATGDLDPTFTGIDAATLGGRFVPGVGPGARSATSPDGRLIARVSPASRMTARSQTHNPILLQDARTGRVVQTLIGHTANVECVMFSPDGRRLVTAGSDRTLKLWDPATGREVFTLLGHTAGVVGLAISADGDRIASGGIDFTARVWDATPLAGRVLDEQQARFAEKERMVAETKTATDEAGQAEVLARAGQWGPAAAALEQAIRRAPDDPALRFRHALALIEAGDRAGYHRACRAVLDRIGDATDRAAPLGVARCWALASVPDAQREALARLVTPYLAEKIPESGQHPNDAHHLAPVLYRLGRYAEAVEWATGCAHGHGGEGLPTDQAFLAMAHHRLGHAEEARRWLDRLVRGKAGDEPGFSWDAAEIRLLRREAEALIGAAPPAGATKKAEAPPTPASRR